MSLEVSNRDINEIKILLVEDDDGDAKAIERAFRSARVANEIIRAHDGLEALDILRGIGEKKITKPYILLVDINMPRMDGLTFVQTLREDSHLNRSLVFILTTSKKDEDKMAAYDMNVAGYILKQKAGEDFLKLVEMIECYWRIIEMPV